MVIGFHDKTGRRLHKAFQDWRKSFPEGYFLAFKARSRAYLHESGCFHPGKINWGGWEYRNGVRIHTSLTKNRKASSKDVGELLCWADIEGISVIPCSHCVGKTLPAKRKVRFQYSEYGQAANTVDNTTHAKAKESSAKVYEGMNQERTVFTKFRSRRLRSLALERANGVCETCQTAFSKLMNGLGERVLQAHHREQLASLDFPRLNGVEDISIVCANCHLLIHLNPKRAMRVEELRLMLLTANAEKSKLSTRSRTKAVY